MKFADLKSILQSGLALFGMMFGAGNVVFPMLLGDYAGTHSMAGSMGFLLGGIAVPILGMVTMMLYRGKHRDFFGRIGQKPGFILFTLLILILGPLGSIPRLITVSYGTLEPYLFGMGLPIFSLLACVGTFLFVFKQGRGLSILAYVLTPILIVSLAVIVGVGLGHHPAAVDTGVSAGGAFGYGLELGYSLLDFVAGLLYAMVIYGMLKKGVADGEAGRKQVVRRGMWSIILASAALSAFYLGLIYVGAFHSAAVDPNSQPVEIVRTLSLSLLGGSGGLVASLAVGMACLTTAISLTIVCTKFVHEEIFKKRYSAVWGTVLTLVISFAMSNLGFSGIAAFVGPTLNFLMPPLIVLCVLNLAHRLYNFQPIKLPVLATAGVMVATHLI